MKQKPVMLIVGICSLAFTLGVFVGSSNSPVTGIAITGVLGILGPLLTWQAGKIKKEDKSPENVISLNQLGIVLTLFSLFIFFGALLGENYRNSQPHTEKFLIWSKEKPPSSTYEALDWITVTEILTAKGYSATQVDSIYAIRISEMSDSSKAGDRSAYGYSESSPYWRMLDKIPAKEVKRGPASE